MTENLRVLLFVYNANSGALNALGDLVHKVISPSTYPCKLCDITYGVTGMRREWSSFIKRADFKSVFTYRDLLPSEYPQIQVDELPAVFLLGDSGVKKVIGAQEFALLENIPSLISLLESKMALLTDSKG